MEGPLTLLTFSSVHVTSLLLTCPPSHARAKLSVPIPTFVYKTSSTHPTQRKGSLESFEIRTSLYMSQIFAIHKLPTLSRTIIMPSIQVILISLVASALFIFLVVRETLSPVHIRTIFRRKQWRLPPGPTGHPLVGNLVEFRHARRSVPALIQYVQIQSSPPKSR